MHSSRLFFCLALTPRPLAILPPIASPLARLPPAPNLAVDACLAADVPRKFCPPPPTVEACRMAVIARRLDAWRTADTCLIMAGLPEEDCCRAMDCWRPMPMVDFWYGSCPRAISLGEGRRERSRRGKERGKERGQAAG